MESVIHIPLNHFFSIEGSLVQPKKAEGLILFVHGSGSSRFSPRNNFVASVLNKAGFTTLLIDLLSEKEDSVYATRFDIKLLTERVIHVVEWVKKNKELRNLSIGLFGASTGAAAALEAAAIKPNDIQTIVSRGGRPDLAMKSLSNVTAPTLLIVGENDTAVIELNEKAYQELMAIKKLEIVPHATHLFEESGCLEIVAELSKDWFSKYLALSA